MPIKRGNLDTDTHAGRRPGDDEGRYRGDAPENQGLQRLPAKHQNLGENPGTDGSLSALRRN